MSQLQDYILERHLGQGPLGDSYSARHLFTKKSYLLKILPDLWTREEPFLERLKEQIERLASLQIPHLIPLHTVSFDQGHYFLVNEWVADAVPLVEYLQSQPSPLQIRSLALHLAEAIDALHAEGLIHGSITLQNVLVRPGDPPTVFLNNPCLTQILPQGAILRQLWHHLVATHESPDLRFLEHYYFLAPEQRAGGKSSFASDRYAFGVLVYYLLFRILPDGLFDLPKEGEWETILRATLAQDPEKRSRRLLALFEQKREPRTIEERIQERMRSEHTVSHYSPCDAKQRDVEPLLSEMVMIPGGRFQRGSQEGARDEGPVHEVILPPFSIDIHPVTNEQFVRFLEAMGEEKDGEHHDLIRLRESRIRRVGGKLLIESGYSKHPVVGVTWYGAHAYARWVDKRLPTEAEWEAAAKGGDDGALYPTGEEVEKNHANFFGTDTTLVMSYPANGYGLFDLAGNVYEWCEDWYDYNFYVQSAQEPFNPKGPLQGVYRVLRGGCWKSLKEDLRCAHRHRNNPGVFNRTYGFRCAKS